MDKERLLTLRFFRKIPLSLLKWTRNLHYRYDTNSYDFRNKSRVSCLENDYIVL